MKLNLLANKESSLLVPFPLRQPRVELKSIFKKILDLPNMFLDSMPVSFSTPQPLKAPSVRFSLSGFRRNHRRLYRGFLLILAALVVIGIGYFLIQTGRNTQSLGTSQTPINQTYSVLARDGDGQPTGQNVNFVVTSAEKNKSVLIQGKRANVRNGKMFLLLNFELDNPDNTVYFINPTDLVRYLREDGKRFAPTVHQGILQVRPSSTKTSNIGFVVEADAKNFVLEIGELDGAKQTLEIKL